jgi:hypothetical protein
MLFWRGMRRAWAIAFVVTWFAVVIVLNNNGTSDTASMRYGALVAGIVALVVWYVTRTLARTRGREE